MQQNLVNVIGVSYFGKKKCGLRKYLSLQLYKRARKRLLLEYEDSTINNNGGEQ